MVTVAEPSATLVAPCDEDHDGSPDFVEEFPLYDTILEQAIH